MDYSRTEFKNWICECNLLENAKIQFKEGVNFQNIETLTLDIENSTNLGIVIIYSDGHLFFDFMYKDDPLMESRNWSDDFENYEEIKTKVNNALNRYWKI